MIKIRRGKNLATCALLFACSGLQAAEPEQCKTVRFGATSWTDTIATTAVASNLFQQLGYKPSQTSGTLQIIFGGMRDNRLDTFLGYYKPASDKIITPFLEKGQIKLLSEPNMTEGQQSLAVPNWLADQGLKSYADIARFEKELGGRIYGIESGTQVNTTLQTALKENRFGLKNFKLVESSEAGMLAAVSRSIQRKEPVVFFAWKPHPMNNMGLTYLSGSEELLGPNDGKTQVWTVTRADYAKDCPNANRLLTNIRFTADQENKMMEQLLNHADPKVVAQEFIAANPKVVEGWLDGVTTYSGDPAQPVASTTP